MGVRTGGVTLVLGLAACLLGGACGTDGSSFPDSADSGGGGSAQTGSSGLGGGPGSSGDGGSNGSSGSSGLAECATDTLGGKLVPMQLTILLDATATMCLTADGQFDCDSPTTRWPATIEALQTFFRSPQSAGLSVAVRTFGPVDRYYPSSVATNRCEASQYTAPDFPPRDLPSEDLATQIGTVRVDLGDGDDGDATQTQTGAVIGGSTAYTKAQEVALAGSKSVAMLLVTDGIPQGCGDPAKPTEATEADNQLAVASAAAAAEQGLKLYVLDIVGGTFGNAAVLDAIAAAGGTEQAIAIEDPTNTEAISAALAEIRGKAVSCELAIPQPAQGTPDFDKLNVTWTASNGSQPVVLLRSDDCSDPHGWSYDDPANPTTIRLCSDICSEVLATVGGQLDVVLGCATRSDPVN